VASFDTPDSGARNSKRWSDEGEMSLTPAGRMTLGSGFGAKSGLPSLVNIQKTMENHHFNG
jgi:hypothetical protein